MVVSQGTLGRVLTFPPYLIGYTKFFKYNKMLGEITTSVVVLLEADIGGISVMNHMHMIPKDIPIVVIEVDGKNYDISEMDDLLTEEVFLSQMLRCPIPLEIPLLVTLPEIEVTEEPIQHFSFLQPNQKVLLLGPDAMQALDI